MRSTSILSVTAAIFFTISEYKVKSQTNSDCIYKVGNNTVVSRLFGPCAGANGRRLARNIKCHDGNILHICCRVPIRSDMQRSRQNWFRMVTFFGRKISSRCTERIMCLQSCLDGLSRSPRPDYPEVLSEDSEENRQFVESFQLGETLSCYNYNATDSTRQQYFSTDDCISGCSENYPECDYDRRRSIITELFYRFSRTFHKLGMLAFNATWTFRDIFRKWLSGQLQSHY